MMKLKDKKVELLKEVHKMTPNGFTETTLETVASIWAYFRHLSGNEIFAAVAYQYKEEVLFQINYRNDITTSNIIRYKGIDYAVTRIDTFEGYKSDLKLYCSRRR